MLSGHRTANLARVVLPKLLYCADNGVFGEEVAPLLHLPAQPEMACNERRCASPIQ